MSSYWTNFAKTGDPNGPGLAEWTPFSPTDKTTMQLGARMGTMSIADPDKVAF